LSRPPTFFSASAENGSRAAFHAHEQQQDVGGRDKPGHDEERDGAVRESNDPARCHGTCIMDDLRTITVQVPEHDLQMAQAYTGKDVTETVRAALRKLASMQAQRRLIELRGRLQFSMTLDELRFDRD
jgi:hypothetical protein